MAGDDKSSKETLDELGELPVDGRSEISAWADERVVHPEPRGHPPLFGAEELPAQPRRDDDDRRLPGH